MLELHMQIRKGVQKGITIDHIIAQLTWTNKLLRYLGNGFLRYKDIWALWYKDIWGINEKSLIGK